MSVPSEYETILSEPRGHVRLLTLNRPDKLNAWNAQMESDFIDALDSASGDPAIRAIVVTGAGRAFCAGGDISAWSQDLTGGGERRRAPPLLARDGSPEVPITLARSKPVIAAINGHAVGIGLTVTLACDIRIASDRAKFGTVFRNVGFSGDFGGSYFLQRLVGNERARLLYFTGQILEADEAQSIGMVSKVVPQDDLEQETLAIASIIASGPALAYARMKENLNRAETADLGTLLDQEALNMRLSGTTQDHREAARAFVEKRTPSFSGQ